MTKLFFFIFSFRMLLSCFRYYRVSILLWKLMARLLGLILQKVPEKTWSSQMVTGSAPSLWLVQPSLPLSGRPPSLKVAKEAVLTTVTCSQAKMAMPSMRSTHRITNSFISNKLEDWNLMHHLHQVVNFTSLFSCLSSCDWGDAPRCSS